MAEGKRYVSVALAGDAEDVEFWRSEFMKRARLVGDTVEPLMESCFLIHPRGISLE